MLSSTLTTAGRHAFTLKGTAERVQICRLWKHRLAMTVRVVLRVWKRRENFPRSCQADEKAAARGPWRQWCVYSASHLSAPCRNEIPPPIVPISGFYRPKWSPGGVVITRHGEISAVWCGGGGMDAESQNEKGTEHRWSPTHIHSAPYRPNPSSHPSLCMCIIIWNQPPSSPCSHVSQINIEGSGGGTESLVRDSHMIPGIDLSIRHPCYIMHKLCIHDIRPQPHAPPPLHFTFRNQTIATCQAKDSIYLFSSC